MNPEQQKTPMAGFAAELSSRWPNWDVTCRYEEACTEVDALRQQLAANEQARAEAVGAAGEALLIASAVFAVWGDKFAPGTRQDFRAKEAAFLKLAAPASEQPERREGL